MLSVIQANVDWQKGEFCQHSYCCNVLTGSHSSVLKSPTRSQFTRLTTKNQQHPYHLLLHKLPTLGQELILQPHEDWNHHVVQTANCTHNKPVGKGKGVEWTLDIFCLRTHL